MKMYVVNLFLALIFLTSCTMQQSRVVTMHSYLKVENGQTRDELEQQFGQPKSIEVNDDGTEVYCYVEQLTINGKIVEMRYYYFFIKEEKVYRKLVKVENRPAIIDSNQF